MLLKDSLTQVRVDWSTEKKLGTIIFCRTSYCKILDPTIAQELAMADPRPDVMEIERRRIKRMEMKDQIKYELTSSYSESASSFHPSSGDFIGGKPIRK